MDFPEQFIQRLQSILPTSAYKDWFAASHLPEATVFRVNTLKIEINDLVKQLDEAGFQLSPISWKLDAFQIPHDQRDLLTASEAFHQGLIYIQNPSSFLPPMILDPQPGEEILDLAAAPGGKTLQMACQMRNKGRIAAVEAVKSRFFRLKANLESQGATMVQPYHKDGRFVWKSCPERFDRILLDAPCSSEAGFSTLEPDSFKYWSLKKIKQMQSKQRQLIYSAVQSLKPGGILVYATCTFAPEENEGVISHILKKFQNALTIDDISIPIKNIMDGLKSWGNKTYDEAVQKSIRVLPDGLMKGFYICRLRKLG